MSNPSYFVDHKRGEVNELKALLNNPRLQRDRLRMREVIKKVIAYMTLGIDVSRLFSEMVMASNTKDLVQKKMVYLYLCTYAEQQADLAILAINTLHKDVRDDDPMVRGLALRSLCSLRLPNILEYVMQPVRQRLNDPSAYVRRVAVMGVAKLFTRHPEAVKGSDLVDVLYNMLRDKDPSVISSAVCALNEVLADEGGMAINQQIVMHLLNRLHEFHEWAQCTVLDVVAKYKPQSDEEMFDIMNLLDDRLKHTNSAVVLAATKVFLNFTIEVPDIHQQVYESLKSPLLTLMGGTSTEVAFSVLSHIHILVNRAPGMFDDQFKHFFCRFNDPKAVKILKLQILQDLANPQNYRDILAELGEYVTDIDAEIARKSIQCIGRLSLRIEHAADDAIEDLLSFLDLNMDYVTAEACIVLKDLLRKYPDRYEEVIPAVQRFLKTIDEEEGKVAVIWMIGEYGETIKDAPYILEPLIDRFKEEPSHAVRMELLAAAMKLFFKRPPELQQMLGRLLAAALEDATQIDVRDRALLYYRLLQYDVHEAARVVNCDKETIEYFTESQDQELKDQVFAEFNSLSVVYGQPAKRFVTGVELDPEDEPQVQADDMRKAASASGVSLDNGTASSSSSSSGANTGATATGNNNNSSSASSSSAGVVDLLGFDEDPILGSGGGGGGGSGLQLSPSVAVDKGQFSKQWGSLPVVKSGDIRVSNGAIAGNVQQSLDTYFAGHNIKLMASGPMGERFKFFFYAEESSEGSTYFMQCVFDPSSSTLSVTIKSGGSKASQLYEHMSALLS